MQMLLASLVTSLDVKDAAFKSGMATARSEAQKTGQDFDKSSKQMSSAMDRAADDVERAMQKIAAAAVALQQKVRNVGIGLTAALTVPLAGMAATSNGAAADFETAMNRVHSALVNASPDQLIKLRQAALELGPAVGKSATDAAGAMEDLAKNGLSVTDILSGGLQSALTLSVVGQTDLGSAANLTTDILQQFGKSTSELPSLVNKVSGALDVSKLGFDDYRLALGQTGGVAGGLGITFDDMNTALAATSSYFDSGSDAGTSFKTFLLALNPISADAQRTMDKLGIKFFDAGGQAKTLGEDAEVLRTKLAGLNDKSLREALNNMFGADGMRTAIALMKEGAKGIADTQAQIDKVTADQKTSILLDGEAAATQRLATAWQNLKIQVGDAGIIQAVTATKSAFATMLSILGEAPPWFYQVAAAVGTFAASIGPLILVGGTLAKVILPLMLLRLGPVALAFAAFINPVGVLIRLLGQLALQAGAATLLGVIGTRMIAFAGPIGIAITLLSIFVPLLLKTATASDAMRAAQQAASDAQQKASGIATELAVATGKAKDETLALAKAQRTQAVQAIETAKANMLAARAAFAAANQQVKQTVDSAAQGGISYGGGGSGAGMAVVASSKARDQAMVDYKASLDALQGQLNAFNTLNGAIKQAEGPAPKLRDVDFSAPKKGSQGRDASADAADYAAKLADLEKAQLDAQADLTGSVQARYRANMVQIASDRADYAKELQRDQGISSAQADTLMAEKDKELSIRRMIAEQELNRGLYQQQYDIDKDANDAAQELARGQSSLADTARERLAAELRLLDLQQQQETADLDLILATKDSASAEYQAAMNRKQQLPALFASQRAGVERQNEGPLADYQRSLPTTAAKLNEALENVAVDGAKSLNDQLDNTMSKFLKLPGIVGSVVSTIISSLAKIAIEKAVIAPFANMLGGFLGGGGLSLSSTTASVNAGLAASASSGFASFLSTGSFGGGKAKGGGISASNWYVVGEEGPEIFAPGTSGTIIPNGGKGAGPGGSATHFEQHLHVDGGVDLATRTETYRLADATRQAAIDGMRDIQRRAAR